MPFFQKVDLTPSQRADLADYLQEELDRSEGDRSALERTWEGHIEDWRAQLPTTPKDFPWPGAANLKFPLTAMHADPVYSDFMQTLHAPEDYWTPVARRPDRVNHETPLRRFITALERKYLKMRRINSSALLDQNVLGTAIYKNHWVNERLSVQDYSLDGSVTTKLQRRSQPVIEHIPLNHFYIPADYWEIDPDLPGGAPWVAQKFFLSPEELLRRASSDPRLPAYDSEVTERIARMWEHAPADNVDDKKRDEQKYNPSHHRKIELYEIWVRYDIRGNGIAEDFVVVFHKPTRDILRVIHKPFLHGKRPFSATRYLPTFGFYGMGISEKDQWAQTTLTKLLNATLDNVLVANTRMYAAPLGANIAPGEAIYPGKVWLLGPNESIQEVRMGDVHQSLPLMMQSILNWADLATGISDIRQGNVRGLPNRTPATTVLSMMQESNKRFDMILSNFRDTHGEMGLRLLQNVAQAYRDESVEWQRFCVEALGPEAAQLVIEALSLPQIEFEESFGINVTATSALVNKEAEKQSLIGMMQIVLPMYQQLIPTAQLIEQMPPGSPTRATAEASYIAGIELIKRLLERFDVQNTSQYMGQLETISATLTAQSQGQNPATAGLTAPQLAPSSAPTPPGLPPQAIASLFGL